jgi:Protein of unknown function (DUF3225)
MEIDTPDVVAEVQGAFDRYEHALVSNDVETLDTLFRNDPRTVRFGGTENLFGYEQIKAFRAARSSAGLARTLTNTVVTTYGRDFAIASTLFHRATMPGKVGRQMQTWVRFPDGWFVVAAHVSVIGEE